MPEKSTTPRKPLLLKLRHFAKTIPGARELYMNVRSTFVPTYREDGLATVHNCDFIREPQFKASYDAALEMDSANQMRWRSHVAQWCGFQASLLDGNFVECGVNRAFLSTAVIHSLNFETFENRKKFYLIDTFAGLVVEQIDEEDTAAHYNDYPDIYEFVRNAFGNYSNVDVVRGAVPDVLQEIETGPVAYLSIDMNCVMPERAALEFFWPKMVTGGVVLLDDYGWRGHEAQKHSFDEFAAQVGAKILCLPTGQGLMIKHTA